MQFAIDLPHFGPFSNPRLVAELAYEAEEAGWDGFFLWDHLNYDQAGLPKPVAVADPWILLTAIALRTKYIKFGSMVTPLPRRRPWKLARETVTLDHLSGGRLILGVGLGTNYYGEYHDFGENTDVKVHGEMLDEGLAILLRLWSGEQFSYEGQHYQLSQVQFLPKPLQQPRIPIWIAGNWPHKKPFRRAARFDGVFPQKSGRDLTPEDFRELLGYIHTHRTGTTPFDAVAFGLTSGIDKAQDAAHVASFAQAGATWWLESFDPLQTFEQIRQRIHQGPPRF
ncbi:luciferase-like protein [Ktedonobacter sp. SOSP1-52]|uniref:LLM class flavin-dependent oxidoreductase n=1 Tax=Ktedonobacter sp. SOSP1-52 TaxID=2778366 RepID=UPI0019153920|nr:LLM class flavin-dependent oxidoreductase [Ktedonobacter sp. SOSP1-52]GHO70022.1 luciferase-like protein [Ktedonobacter sp. SOSP1-52]